MNADAFRQVYAYHFAANRKIWDACIAPLTQAQFLQDDAYGVGSVRNQVVHMMNIDDRWFSGLRGQSVPPFADYAAWIDREAIRAEADRVEADVTAYLATVTDEMLLEKAFPANPDDTMLLWQVLYHVANHGTDHRAQLLRQLNALGAKTFPQDYVFFLWGTM